MIRRSIGILLDVALIGLVAAVVLTAAIGPVAALTGRHAAIIGGGSMSPTIPLGSMVVVEPLAGRPLRVGEVASFRTPDGVVVTHRVARVVERPDGTWYETQGDANAHPDPALWPASAATGRLVMALPVAGYASWLFRHPVGWLNIAALAGWLLVARGLVRSGSGPAAPAAARPPVAGIGSRETEATQADALRRAGGTAT